jgi:L-fuculose-phosphate aldolase
MLNEAVLREELVKAYRALAESGLNAGTAGNVSIRFYSSFFITPTGADSTVLSAGQIVRMGLDGQSQPGQAKPSSEWRFHRDIYAARLEIQAIVHTHSPYATALACRRQSIPAFHYMVALAGGDSIRCAPYATFGTQELSDGALQALRDRRACLLANHGMIALGDDLASALKMAQELESLAHQYVISLQLGGPVLLDDAEMRKVLERFKTYGRQDTTAD